MPPPTYEEARMHYQPSLIRALFIGESRPTGGTFFFNENSNLYRATKIAFEQVSSTHFNCEMFRQYGCWLYDVCTISVNNLPRADKIALIRDGIPALRKIIQELNPEYIFVVKKGDFGNIVYPQILDLGFRDGLTSCLLPFPLYQYRKQYIDMLAAMLKETILRGNESGFHDQS